MGSAGIQEVLKSCGNTKDDEDHLGGIEHEGSLLDSIKPQRGCGCGPRVITTHGGGTGEWGKASIRTIGI